MFKTILVIPFFLLLLKMANAQVSEIRIHISSGPFWSKLDVTPSGVFENRNQTVFLSDMMVTYQRAKFIFGLGFSAFPIKTDPVVINSFERGYSTVNRMGSVALQVGHEFPIFKERKMAFELFMGNYFLFNHSDKSFGSGTVVLPPFITINNSNFPAPIQGSFDYTYQQQKGLMFLPYVGFWVKKKLSTKMALHLGVKHTIGVETLQSCPIVFKESGQTPKPYLLNYKGTGTQLMVALSFRLWRTNALKEKEDKTK